MICILHIRFLIYTRVILYICYTISVAPKKPPKESDVAVSVSATGLKGEAVDRRTDLGGVLRWFVCGDRWCVLVCFWSLKLFKFTVLLVSWEFLLLYYGLMLIPGRSAAPHIQNKHPQKPGKSIKEVLFSSNKPQSRRRSSTVVDPFCFLQSLYPKLLCWWTRSASCSFRQHRNIPEAEAFETTTIQFITNGMFTQKERP